jgi:uncharacterized integral membrane protein
MTVVSASERCGRRFATRVPASEVVRHTVREDTGRSPRTQAPRTDPSKEHAVRAFSLIFLVALVAVLAILAIENNRTTTIDVWKWSWDLPFPVVAVGLYALGMLTGWALIGAVKRSWRRVTEYERA